MTKIRSSTILLAIALAFILLFQFACSLVESKAIYEDPEHVDFGPAETATPDEDIESPVEDAEVANPEDSLPPTEEVYFEQDGIKLYYDPQLVLDVEPLTETIPAASGDEMYEPAHPAYVHFNLYMEQAQVYVAPIDEYLAVADFAPTTISNLQNLISQQVPQVDGCIPELPLKDFYRTCDHQQFNSNIGYFDFQNGSGVRFVSVYGIQDLAPVDNEHLTYVFQGFTEDGKYYLKATVRILHSQLPEIGEIPADIYAADAATVAAYFADFGELLNQNEAEFAPALDWIDAFLSSLRVE